MTIRTTLWRMEPHTMGKHLVLRSYLHAWLPILGRRSGRILFVDGFAGPGEYEGGEEGSPVVAIKAFNEHRAKDLISAEVVFYFIEKEHDRFLHLQGVIDRMQPQLPPRTRVECVNAGFGETLNTRLQELEAQNKQLAPALVMIDPFGVSDVAMSVIGRILRNRQTEVYISFMWDFFNRFKEHPNFEPPLDELFGCPDWRRAFDIADVQDRKRFTFDLYKRCLKDAGARHVVHFELYEGSRLVYAIFFATGHPLGCEKMKEAIWKIDPFAGFAFRPGRDASLDLFGGNNLAGLKTQLRQVFGPAGWVSVEQMCAWMRTDETDYYPGQLRKALRELEAEGAIEVDPTGRKAKSFPDRTRLRFRSG